MADEIQAILTERGKSHGNFDDNARISQRLKDVVRTEATYKHLTSIQREAIDMILHKISRAVAGNASFQDHWDDIAGYAKLVSERCPAVKAS